MQSWQLPEYIADILPSTARQLESAKEALLALFRVHGYELVSPPQMEYTTSLLTAIDPVLSLKTIRVVDQISGLQLGMRADITPQVARIDAHLLSAKTGVNRLCYAGSVLHARPETQMSSREPLQIGAELYGFDGVEADIELVDLMFKSLAIANIPDLYLALGHVGIFHALADLAHLNDGERHQLRTIMQNKDIEQAKAYAEGLQLPSELVAGFAALPTLYGGLDVLERAHDVLPKDEKIQAALAEVEAVCRAFADKQIHIDFSELRFASYHTGLLFSIYAPNWSDALARGGRYNGLGKHFGRARPATGFSFDLRDLISALPERPATWGVCISKEDYLLAAKFVEKLRAAGETVVVDYLGEGAQALSCNRELVCVDGTWQLVPSAK